MANKLKKKVNTPIKNNQALVHKSNLIKELYNIYTSGYKHNNS